MRITWIPAALAALVVVCPGPAHAQLYEDVGTRAQGLGGAFVAVADDATASWWNPAGLATGAIFNVVFERGRSSQPGSPAGVEPARRVGTNGFASAFPSLGLSHYRLRISQIGPITSTDPAGQNREESVGRVRSLAVNQYGITVGQSLGDHLVLGSTVKLLRAGAASALVDGTSDPLDVGDDLELSNQTRVDLDAGAMLAFTHFRAGLSVRNLTRPKFGAGSDRFTLRRQARAGVALVTGPQNVWAFTWAADADLTRTTTPFGDVRHVATGVEAWLKRRLGLRGGLTANTIDDSRMTTSGGVSIAVTPAFFIEAARTFGSDGSIRGWSSSLRLTY